MRLYHGGAWFFIVMSPQKMFVIVVLVEVVGVSDWLV